MLSRWECTVLTALAVGIGCSPQNESLPIAPTTKTTSASTNEYDTYALNGRVHLGHETVSVRKTADGWAVDTAFVAEGPENNGEKDTWRGTLTTTSNWTPIHGSWHGRLGGLRKMLLRPQADRLGSLELVTEREQEVPIALPDISRVDLFLPGEAPGVRTGLCHLATDSTIERILFPGVKATIGPRQLVEATSAETEPLERVVLKETTSVLGPGPLEVICRGTDLILSHQDETWTVAVGHEPLARDLGATF